MVNSVSSEGAMDGIHGVGGTMHVESPRYHNALHDVFFEAAKQYGLKANPDFNDWSQSQVGAISPGASLRPCSGFSGYPAFILVLYVKASLHLWVPS